MQTTALQAAERGKVLFVAPQPFFEDRGTPIATRQVLEALGQLGWETDLLTFPVGKAVEISGTRVFRAANPFRVSSVPIGFSLRKVALDLTLTAAMARMLRGGGYSCVHALEEAAFPAVLLGRRYRVPVIYDMQSSLPEQMRRHAAFRGGAAQWVLGRCERWLLRRADFVMSSAGLAAHVRALAPEARVREWRYSSEPPVIPAGELAELREELRLAEGARVVLYSGTFEPYQGVEMLLEAIPRVLAEVPETVFVLLGAEGAAGDAVARRAADLSLGRGVRLLGRQPRERLPRFLALAEVLVSPRAYGRNAPLKVFDYLAAGRAIVATAISSHHSVLDGSRAVLAPPNPAALAEAVVGVLRDPERAARLAAAAREYAERMLGWVPFVRSVEELYEEAHAGRAPHPGV